MEINTIHEVVHLSQLGLLPMDVDSLHRVHDKLTMHLAADLCEVCHVLDRYNLTLQSLATVLEQLHNLDSEEGVEEEEISEGDSEGLVCDSDPEEVE